MRFGSFQDYRASLNQVQIDLLGDVGQVLDSRTEPFGAPDAALTVVVEPAVDGVYGLALLFDGDAIRVREIEVFGATTVDLGSALQDVTFAGTAGIRVESRRRARAAKDSNRVSSLATCPPAAWW